VGAGRIRALGPLGKSTPSSALVRDELEQRLRQSPGIRRIEASITEAVATGSLPAATGADELLKAFDPTAQNPDHG